MKIQAGRLRGKNVEARQDRSLRPTKSFIRESMFNILRHGKFLYADDFVSDDNPSLIEDRAVLDIFCGTGILGLEAISRGASHVTFVDQSHETMKLARFNAKQLGIEEACKFVRNDSTQLPKAPKPVDLVFIDPPYGQELAPKSLKSLKNQGWVRHGTVAVVELGKQDAIPDVEGYALLTERLHDKTRVVIMQYRES